MAEYEEEGRIVRLEWTCRSCDHKNPGGTRTCEGCGTPMESGEGFAMPAQAQAVTDAAEIERAKRGPDVHCAYCGGRNPAGTQQCTQCGAALAEGTARKAGQVVGQPPAAPPRPLPAAPTPQRKWLIPAVIALVLLGFFALTRTRDASVSVAAVSWNTAITYEEARTVQRDGWRRDMPSGARILTSERRLHHNQDVVVGRRDQRVTERVQVGTKKELVRTEMRDKGNGYAQEVKIYKDVPVYEDREVTKSVPITTPSPVYDTWCRYEAEEWQPQTAQRQGTDVVPLWPEIQTGPRLREKERKATYKVTFSDGSKTYEYEAPTADAFARFTPGSTWKVKVNGMGSVVQVM